MNKTLLTILSSAVLSIGAHAQVELNEIYASHDGTDTQEFIELEGTPSLALTDYLVLIVEGDSPNNGILDRVYDLSSFTMPADGFFVLGDAAVANIDLNIGTQDSIENGSETFYLVKANNATDKATLIGLLNTNLDPDLDLITTIPTLATIVDIVAMIDSGASDKVYDGAIAQGPDGTFFPAGIFRGNDARNEWCKRYLDFTSGNNTNLQRTPGVANVLCCHSDQGSTQGPGVLELTICGGPLVPNNRVDLAITGGLMNQGGILILGDTFVGAPLLGATFGPVPILVSVPVTLDANGERAIASFLGTNGNLSGITAYIQVIVLESISPILTLGGSNTVKLDFQ